MTLPEINAELSKDIPQERRTELLIQKAAMAPLSDEELAHTKLRNQPVLH